MLKTYTKLEDVPEALREHYKLEGGQYVPHLSDDHPVLKHNKTLLAEKAAESARVKELEADIEQAKSTSVPRGHVAVPKADAELLGEVKTLGTIADVKAKLAEHETLKTKVAETERTDTRRKVAAALGYNEAAFLQLSNLPDFEIREKDGKKSVVALVKDGEKVVEKVGSEFVESTYAPLLPALKTKAADTQVPTSGGGGGTTNPTDPFAAAREFGKQWNETAKNTGDVASRFGIAKTA